MVEPHGVGMVLFTLRAADEVRASQFGSAVGELDPEMVAIARAIITQRTNKFDPSTYRDRYQEALRELIEAKVKGLPIKPRVVAEAPPVIDLLAALKRGASCSCATLIYEVNSHCGEIKCPSIPASSVCSASRRNEVPSNVARGFEANQPILFAAGPNSVGHLSPQRASAEVKRM